MNKYLVNAFCWAIGSVFSVLNIAESNQQVVWSIITILFAWNAIKQFQRYQEAKKDNG